jgi:hypothetical protein
MNLVLPARNVSGSPSKISLAAAGEEKRIAGPKRARRIVKTSP